MNKHLVIDLCIKYGIEIVDWEAHDFNEDSLVDINEFIYKLLQCNYYVVDKQAYDTLIGGF